MPRSVSRTAPAREALLGLLPCGPRAGLGAGLGGLRAEEGGAALGAWGGGLGLLRKQDGRFLKPGFVQAPREVLAAALLGGCPEPCSPSSSPRPRGRVSAGRLGVLLLGSFIFLVTALSCSSHLTR